MAKSNFNWSEFIRIAVGVFFTGIGVILFGNSGGQLLQLGLGIVSVAIGLAVLLSK